MKDLPPMVKLTGGGSVSLPHKMKNSPAMLNAPMALFSSSISAEGPVIRLVP